MRGLEIAILVIFISASIGFLGQIGIFGTQYGYEERGPYMFWTVSNLTAYQDKDLSVFDQVKLYIQFTIDSILWLAQIMFSIIVIYPVLVDTFHVPAAAATVISLGVWMSIVLGYAQWRAARSTEGLR